MSKREYIAESVSRLSEEDLDRLLAFLRTLSEESSADGLPRLAAEAKLAEEWLSPEEDAAWANL